MPVLRIDLAHDRRRGQDAKTKVSNLEINDGMVTRRDVRDAPLDPVANQFIKLEIIAGGAQPEVLEVLMHSTKEK